MGELSPEIADAINAAVDRAVAKYFKPHHQEYLRCAEVAAVLKVHPDTVKRMIRDGRLQSVGSNKSLRITQASLDDYLTRCVS